MQGCDDLRCGGTSADQANPLAAQHCRGIPAGGVELRPGKACRALDCGDDRVMQAAGGGIEITSARMQQGETTAIGSGSLSINNNGRLEGQLRVTVAGVEAFLNSIGAQQMVQASPSMDKLSGALDRSSRRFAQRRGRGD